MPESKIIQWKQKGENSDEDQYNNEENSENEYTDGEITETEEREDKNLIAGTNSNKSPKNVSLTEYWKRRRWKKYLKKVDNEWQLLNLGIENVIKKMIERNNAELEKWETQQAHKWLHSNNLYAQYASLYKKITPSIEIDNVIEQMGNKLKEKIYNRWNNLQTENENNIRKWVIEQWNEWKNAKIISWLMCDWKRNENEKWVQWKNKYRYHIKYAPNRNEYHVWQKRTNIEKKQWSNWVRIKEDHYIYNIEILCNKEKNAYKKSIIKWINDIADNFVKNPQLRLWIEQQQVKPFPRKKLLKGSKVKSSERSNIEINA
ncbi:Tryptophan-Threonine-rich plasmodium antigen C terminal, putative [Plasmodium berghei]|uniref:Tryptophan-Threonine-rich plasmodium antigen C terminal, putative n=1 Tax=Plasmodium berghei TaxID=5821 RepID=A0A1D3S9T7_PLABE|nr:Tryptophan-Threonine-rich plasmodium antigen C terminal, putative [Plasmodium berghei]